MPSTLTTAISIFLSTPSVRRATVPPASSSAGGTISIHALREEGDLCSYSIWHSHTVISIHALREEGDNGFEKTSKGIERFLSTPSVRRATNTRSMRCRAETISIHALREEGD